MRITYVDQPASRVYGDAYVTSKQLPSSVEDPDAALLLDGIESPRPADDRPLRMTLSIPAPAPKGPAVSPASPLLLCLPLPQSSAITLERKKEIPYKKGKAEDIICPCGV